MIRFAALLALAVPAHGMTLPPGATLSATAESPRNTLVFPVGPWEAAGVPSQTAEGALRRESWVLPETQLTTAEILSPMREALEVEGFNILYSCRDVECGGFDFRYALDLLPEPGMHVDLGDYRYLAARKSGARDVVSLVVSRAGETAYIHITRVGEAGPARVTVARTSEAAPVSDAETALIEQLTGTGHAVLEDLAFATGSAALEEQAFPSLGELAAWLRGDTARRVVLVGHSDAVGALDRNIALSRARAEAVLERLVTAHEVPRGQMEAEGIGFLSPRASSETEAGRAANRRVEVVLPAP
ncbi:MAG: OmpA family protein [Pseudomonadota bacterium]